jgi:hypothetical protein
MANKAHPKSRTAKLKIERQEIIKQVQTKSYEIVRLSRVKYIGNDYNFIDVRFFQRAMDDDLDDVYHPTRKGVQLREDLFLNLIDAHFIASLERQIDESGS